MSFLKKIHKTKHIDDLFQMNEQDETEFTDEEIKENIIEFYPWKVQI